MTTPQPEAGPSLSEDYALLEEDVLAETSTTTATRADVANTSKDDYNDVVDEEVVKKDVQTLRELFPEHSLELLKRAVISHPDNIDYAASVVANDAVSDEQLAQSLQAEEARRSRARNAAAAAQQHQYARNRSGGAVSSGNTFRPTARVLARAVEVLRDVVIPTVHTRLKSLSFSNFTSQSSTGNVTYTLRDVGVVALSLPTDHITVRSVGGVVQVHLVNMYLSLAIGKFHYESTGFIPWNDEGSLDTSVSGLTAVAALIPARTHSEAVRLLVRDIDVRIEGAVRVRTVGTSADWAYNTLAAVCKPLITSYIKETVEQQLRATLTSELRSFLYVPPADEEPENGTAAGTEAPVMHEASVAPIQASIDPPAATSAPS